MNESDVLNKYKDYKRTKIQSGYTCETLRLTKGDDNLILQLYYGNTLFQASKKYKLTNFIKQHIDIPEIPEALEYGEDETFSYLLSEFKEGNEVVNSKELDYKVFYKSLAQILSKIHSVDVGKSFGWIGKDGLYGHDLFYDYAKDEVERNIKIIEDILTSSKYEHCNELLNEIKEKSEATLLKLKNINASECVLDWYDINFNNILVDSSSKITGFLDAGGARNGIREWDIAFIKMNLCKDDERFQYFCDEYCKFANMKLNNELIDLMTEIVEVNDLSFMLSAKSELPVPYCSNFYELRQGLMHYLCS